MSRADPQQRRLAALWSQVLLVAIRDAAGNVFYHSSPAHADALQRAALHWIFDPPPQGGWSSFDGLCQLFDWCPGHIRARLMRQPAIARGLKKFNIAR